MAHCKANGQNCNTHMLGANHFCLYKAYMEYIANVRAQHFPSYDLFELHDKCSSVTY